MPASRTVLASFLATEGLAFTHLTRVLTGRAQGYLLLLEVAAAVIALAASVLMLRKSCFECQVVASVVAAASGLAAVLACTVGLPGQHAHEVRLSDVLFIGLGVALPLLTALSLVPTAARRVPQLDATLGVTRPAP